MTIMYGKITTTIKVRQVKATGPTALCHEMEKIRLETSRAEHAGTVDSCLEGRDGEA